MGKPPEKQKIKIEFDTFIIRYVNNTWICLIRLISVMNRLKKKTNSIIIRTSIMI